MRRKRKKKRNREQNKRDDLSNFQERREVSFDSSERKPFAVLKGEGNKKREGGNTSLLLG